MGTFEFDVLCHILACHIFFYVMQIMTKPAIWSIVIIFHDYVTLLKMIEKFFLGCKTEIKLSSLRYRISENALQSLQIHWHNLISFVDFIMLLLMMRFLGYC